MDPDARSPDAGPDASPPTPAARLRTIMRELDLLAREIAPPPAADDTGFHDDLRELARGLLWQRVVFAQTLGGTEFVDPASSIMLFLYASGSDATPSTGDCCKAAGVPRTTALRWIGVLEHRNLVRSVADPADGRRTVVTLTDDGRVAMHRCLAAISAALDGGLVR